MSLQTFYRDRGERERQRRADELRRFYKRVRERCEAADVDPNDLAAVLAA